MHSKHLSCSPFLCQASQKELQAMETMTAAFIHKFPRVTPELFVDLSQFIPFMSVSDIMSFPASLIINDSVWGNNLCGMVVLDVSRCSDANSLSPGWRPFEITAQGWSRCRKRLLWKDCCRPAWWVMSHHGHHTFSAPSSRCCRISRSVIFSSWHRSRLEASTSSQFQSGRSCCL